MADSPNEIKRKRQREVLLPVPTPNLVTERDFGKPLVLEVEHLAFARNPRVYAKGPAFYYPGPLTEP